EPPPVPARIHTTATPAVGIPRETPAVGIPRVTPVVGVPRKSPPVGLPRPAIGVSRKSPPVGIPRPTPAVGVPKKTPLAVPAVPPAAVPEFTADQPMTGRVDIALARSGSVSVSPRTGAAPSWPIDPNAPRSGDDPRSEEYRALFAEFVKLRRTTGESVE